MRLKLPLYSPDSSGGKEAVAGTERSGTTWTGVESLSLGLWGFPSGGRTVPCRSTISCVTHLSCGLLGSSQPNPEALAWLFMPGRSVQPTLLRTPWVTGRIPTATGPYSGSLDTQAREFLREPRERNS